MQCLLLSDGKHSAHQNHTIVLPADGGSGVAAISFTGALKIPVSTRAWGESQNGAPVLAVKRNGLVNSQAHKKESVTL